jgi:hypothetical protein
VTNSNGGHVVGKEFDLGADVPLTDHASLQYPRALTELGWRAVHPRRASDGEPEERCLTRAST